MEHSDEIFEHRDFESLTRNEFEGCVFTRCKFIGVHLSSCRFLQCKFEGCDFSLVKLLGTSFRDVHFVDCKAIGINWSETTGLHSTNFTRCKLDDACFQRMDLRHILFEDCQLVNADFQETRLDRARFSGSRLSGAIFQKTSLVETDFSSARDYTFDPRGNKLKNTKIALTEALGILGTLGINVVP